MIPAKIPAGKEDSFLPAPWSGRSSLVLYQRRTDRKDREHERTRQASGSEWAVTVAAEAGGVQGLGAAWVQELEAADQVGCGAEPVTLGSWKLPGVTGVRLHAG